MLDQFRKDAKQKYSEALSAYVTRYFGRPLEKLNVSIFILFYTNIAQNELCFNCCLVIF